MENKQGGLSRKNESRFEELRLKNNNTNNNNNRLLSFFGRRNKQFRWNNIPSQGGLEEVCV